MTFCAIHKYYFHVEVKVIDVWQIGALRPPVVRKVFNCCGFRTFTANVNVSLPVSAAYRVYGGPSVLQHHRRPAAVVLGQCTQILCPAKLPWRDSPPAGKFRPFDVSLRLGWDIYPRSDSFFLVMFVCTCVQAANSYLRDQWFHSIQWKVRSGVSWKPRNPKGIKLMTHCIFFFFMRGLYFTGLKKDKWLSLH